MYEEFEINNNDPSNIEYFDMEPISEEELPIFDPSENSIALVNEIDGEEEDEELVFKPIYASAKPEGSIDLKGVVNFPTLNVRLQPSLSSPAFTVISEGEEVTILDETDDHLWYHIVVHEIDNDYDGYCMEEYIDIV